MTGHLFKRQLAFRVPISINYYCAGASVAWRKFQFGTSSCSGPRKLKRRLDDGRAGCLVELSMTTLIDSLIDAAHELLEVAVIEVESSIQDVV